MENNIYKTYLKEIEKLKNDKNIKSIILVGSSKNKDLEKDCKINDIDLFVIVENQEKDQVRVIKTINNVEFDFNFISIEGSNNFIEGRVYFFLKIKDGKLIYDIDNIGANVMKLCEMKYEEGPDKLSVSQKNLEITQLTSDISRLNEKDNYDDFEYDFLIYMYLSKVIKLYYLINDEWLPKDKVLLKSLKNDNYHLYELCVKVKGDNMYGKLMDVVKYTIEKSKWGGNYE
ncbi:MAG: hypothetical protein RSD36_15970 [Terrisporobacter sp.]